MTTHRWCGAHPGAGRKRLYAERMVLRSMQLPQAAIDDLIALGDGNVAEGVRRMWAERAKLREWLAQERDKRRASALAKDEATLWKYTLAESAEIGGEANAYQDVLDWLDRNEGGQDG